MASLGEKINELWQHDAAGDRRLHRAMFGAVLIVVVVSSALILAWAAGLRRNDIGLSAAWRPASLRREIDSVLAQILNKQRLANFLVADTMARDKAPAANPAFSITPAGEQTFDFWATLNAIADAVTSEGARGVLAARLETRAVSSRAAVVEAFRGFRQGTLTGTQDAAGAVKTGSDAASQEFKWWLDEVLPEPALAAIVTANKGATTPGKTREALLAAFEKYFWSERPAEKLVAGLNRKFEVGALDDSVVQPAAKDFTARLVWTISGVLFVTAALVAAFGSVLKVRELVEPNSSPWVGLFVVTVGAGLAAGSLLPEIGAPVLARAVAYFNDLYSLRLEQSARVFNGLAAAAIVALLAASWTAFLRELGDGHSPNSRDDELKLQLETVRWSFNTGTALLVVGVIEVFALSQWPSAFASDAAASSLTTAATAAAGGVGIVFSLILLVMYVPASQVLRERTTKRIAKYAKEASAPGLRPEEQEIAKERKESLEAALTANGLQWQTSQQLMKLAQALLPLLVASGLQPLFGLLGQG